MRKSSSARKSRSSSGSKMGSSFFAKKRTKSASRGKSAKTFRPKEKKKRFVKPPHDPGPKIREDGAEVVEEYSVEEGGEGIQQALQSTGSGCCGSITGFFWLLAIGGFAVIIIFILKCGGC